MLIGVIIACARVCYHVCVVCLCMRVVFSFVSSDNSIILFVLLGVIGCCVFFMCLCVVIVCCVYFCVLCSRVVAMVFVW